MRIFIPLIWLAFAGGIAAAETVATVAPTRDMARGDIVREDDLATVQVSARSLRGTSLATERSGLVGMELRRGVRAGRPLRLSDVKRPSAVRKGQPVTLVYRAPGLQLTVDGRALADAAAGEGVRVVNLHSKRTVGAVAIGTGLAEVPAR